MPLPKIRDAFFVFISRGNNKVSVFHRVFWLEPKMPISKDPSERRPILIKQEHAIEP